ncbi:MAG TPA: toprim domain-containing protein [Streptosporangiaceae bacterium]
MSPRPTTTGWSPVSRDPRSLTEAAARFFARSAASSWVPGYLASRGIDARTACRWQVGYAPAGRTELCDHLRGLGYTSAQARAVGLARPGFTDVFRDRAMFAVRAVDGTVAGFIGRATVGGVPVYLNTAATELYRKGSLLFGLYEGAEALAAGARPVLVEGPLDALAVSCAGRVGVAPCGTALTAEQAELLGWAMRRPRQTGVAVAFDADRAGRAAAVRAYSLLRAITDELWTVSWPAGTDPADVLRAGGAAGLAAVLDSSLLPLPDLVVDARLAAFGRWLEFADGAFAALRAVAPVIAGLPPAQVARQVARTAGRLGLSYAEVTEAVTSALTAISRTG